MRINKEFVFEDFESVSRSFLPLLRKNAELKKRDKLDYKSELYEVNFLSYHLEKPEQWHTSSPTFMAQPIWMANEILSEFLNISPQLMFKYRSDIMQWSYGIEPEGCQRYTYGARWFEFGQLKNTFEKLQANPTSKKAVVQIYMPYDTDLKHKDVPCTTGYMLNNQDGKLHITAMWRSQDALSGFRYDVAVTNFLQQALAGWLGLEIGELHALVNSFHYYGKDQQKLENICTEFETTPRFHANTPASVFKLSRKEFYKQLGIVKEIEEDSYNGRFKGLDAKIQSINSPYFRDFARIYLHTNLKRYKDTTKVDFEGVDFQRWVHKT